MQVGTISKLVYDKQYGKIKTDAGQDAHFHKGCLWNTSFVELTEGQNVEFEIQQSYRGFIAFHIRPYSKAFDTNARIEDNI